MLEYILECGNVFRHELTRISQIQILHIKLDYKVICEIRVNSRQKGLLKSFLTKRSLLQFYHWCSILVERDGSPDVATLR